MIEIVKTVFYKITDILYPPRCMVCGDILAIDKNRWFCDRCYDSIEPLKPVTCAKCGEHINDDSRKYCVSCHPDGQKENYKNYSFMIYDDIAKEIIYNLKYKGCKNYSEGLVEIISNKMDLSFVKDTDIIIPVPLHKNRQKERGFNQSELIAYHLSVKTGKPLHGNVLIRHRDTVKQSKLGSYSRKLNIRGAFELSNTDIIANKNLLLIDDIYTSGVTISECADILLSGGAKSVVSLTVCKTGPIKGSKDGPV